MGGNRLVQVAGNLVRTRRATRVLHQLHAARKNLPKREHLQVALFLPRIFIIDVSVIKIITSQGIYKLKVTQETSTRIYRSNRPALFDPAATL